MKTKVALISLFNIDFGIRHISSYLNYKGYATNVISFGILKFKEELFRNSNYLSVKPLRQKPCPEKDAESLINLLFSLKPDLIGISVPSTSFITASLLTKRIKEKLDIPVVWGGIHPTLCPEDCIPYTDIVCIGEGEYPMHDIAEKLENRQKITAIKNLWIKHADGSIEKNELRDLILELDDLPYPDFVNLDNKFIIDRGKVTPESIFISAYVRNSYPAMSSRGCPNQCSFCCNSVLKVIYKDKGPYLRRRSPENVIDELAYIRKNRELNQIRFWDDIFTYDLEWVEQFYKLYTKEIALPFSCYAHPKYTNKIIMEMLADAGLNLVDIGIQSGSESFCRDKFKRDQSNEEIIKFANLLKKLGVTPRYNVIVDDPYETDSDSEATADLLLALPSPYIAALYSLCYFPKTGLTAQALKDKLITEKEIEGKHNKALNNFFMFIDLAQDKKRFFWDTIIAMVVSEFFPQTIIKRCKQSRFMRHHPKCLLFLARLYVRISAILPKDLFPLLSKKPIKLTRILKIFLLNLAKRFPRTFFLFVKLFIRINMFRKEKSNFFMSCILTLDKFENRITEAKNQISRDKTNINLLVYPALSKNISRIFYLKLKQIEKNYYSSSIKLMIGLVEKGAFMFSSRKNSWSVWEMELEMDSAGKEIEMELLYPGLFFTIDGVRKEVALKKLRNTTATELFELDFFIYDRFQKMFVLKNCIILHKDDILNSEGFANLDLREK